MDRDRHSAITPIYRIRSGPISYLIRTPGSSAQARFYLSGGQIAQRSKKIYEVDTAVRAAYSSDGAVQKEDLEMYYKISSDARESKTRNPDDT
jgi:hypothetical protein